MTSAEPSLTLTAGSLVIGLAASILWTVTKFLIIAAHHGGQALVASASGDRIKHVELLPKRSKLVVQGVGKKDGELSVLSLLIGYLSPPLFGLLGTTMLANGLTPDVVLWTALILLVIFFLQMKNPFGLIVIALYGTLLFMLARNDSPGLRALSAYSLVWFMLLGGVVHTTVNNLREGYATELRKATMIPIALWGAFWWLANMAALIYGGGILFRVIAPPLG